MAATIPIEEEIGTVSTRPHPHNGSYAGNFRDLSFEAALWKTFRVA